MVNNDIFLRYFLVIFLSIIHFSCSANKTEQQKTQQEEISVKSYVREQIKSDGKKKIYYGSDSVYSYSEVGTLESIGYSGAGKIRTIYYYPNGDTQAIFYTMNSEDDTMQFESFYDTGKLESAVYIIPDTMIKAGEVIRCDRKSLQYFKNGGIKSIGYSQYGMEGSYAGLVKFFDETGRLIKTQDYLFWGDNRSCIVESEYYDNGQAKWDKWYWNYVYYETDEEYKEPIGTWKYYDRNGKLIKMEKHTELENQETLEKDR